MKAQAIGYHLFLPAPNYINILGFCLLRGNSEFVA